VIPVQLALGWAMIRHAQRPSPGLPALGVAFHAAALVAVLPAVLSSPWNATHPWMVVNLTWFHVAWLALGSAVFAPLLFVRGRALRAYPWIAAGALAALGVFLLTAETRPAVGVREGFAWMGREDEFMGAVWESRGLLGAGAAFDPLSVLGFGALVLPFAWAAVAWQAFRRHRHTLLPWAIAVPLLAAQSARQVRFADALAVPMAVVLAWGCVAAVRSAAVRSRMPRSLARAAWAPWAAVTIALVVSQWGTPPKRARHARDVRVAAADCARFGSRSGPDFRTRTRAQPRRRCARAMELGTHHRMGGGPAHRRHQLRNVRRRGQLPRPVALLPGGRSGTRGPDPARPPGALGDADELAPVHRRSDDPERRSRAGEPIPLPEHG
jgi:hypothetical protein